MLNLISRKWMAHESITRCTQRKQRKVDVLEPDKWRNEVSMPSFLNRLKRYMRNEQRRDDSGRGLSDYINEMYTEQVARYMQAPIITTAWQDWVTTAWTDDVTQRYTDTQIRMMWEIGVGVRDTNHHSHYIYYLWHRTWIVCDVPWFYSIDIAQLTDGRWFDLYIDIVNWNHQTVERVKLFLWDNELHETWWRIKEFIYLSELMKKIKRSNPLSKHLSDVDRAIFEFWIYAN